MTAIDPPEQPEVLAARRAMQCCDNQDLVPLDFGIDYCASCDSIRNLHGMWRPRRHWEGFTTVGGVEVTHEQAFAMAVARARKDQLLIEAERAKRPT